MGNTTITSPTQLKNKLRGLLYLRNITPVYNDWIRGEKNITGFYCRATSFLRTGSAIERLKEFIRREKLPLTVEEKNNGQIRLLIKDIS